MMRFKLFFLFTFLLFTQIVIADHSSSSDWEYECIPNSNGRFRIKFIMYRDCQKIPLCAGSCNTPCTIQIQLTGADPTCNNTNYGIRTLNLVSVRDAKPLNIAPNAKTICNNMGCVTPGTLTPGIERYEFVGEVDLGPASGIPTNCCNVRFSYSLCCRSSAIATGSANANFYTDMVINRCFSTNPCNSSPAFKNELPYAVPSGQPIFFNNGAVDPDNDSLSYAFVPSLAGQGAQVAYTAPFSFDRPMPWSGPANGTFPAGISCNPVTGDVGFTSNAGTNFAGVMAIQVQQWRKNVSTGQRQLVGTTRRDMQMWIVSSPSNNPPTLRTIPSLNGNPLALRTTWEVGAGNQLCFDIIAKDTDFKGNTVSDTTYLSWNQSLAKYGATFTPNYDTALRKTNGPREDTYKFCWTPHDSLASDLPYRFSVNAIDSRSPVAGIISRSFSIKVIKYHPPIFPVSNVSFCPGEGATIGTLADSTFSYQWFKNGNLIPGSDTPLIYVNQPGSYQVVVRKATGTYDTSLVKSVTYLPFAEALVTLTTDSVVCKGKPATIKVNKVSGTNIQWLRNGVVIPGNNKDSLLTIFDGSYQAVLSTSVGCRDTSSAITLTSIPFVESSISTQDDTLQCIGKTVKLYIVSPNIGYTYQWLSNTTPIVNATDTMYVIQQPGKYRVLSSNTQGCRDTSNAINIQYYKYVAGAEIFGNQFISDTAQVYTYYVTQPQNNQLTWVIENGILISGQGNDTIQVKWNALTTATIRLFLTNSKNCRDTVVHVVSVGNIVPAIFSFTPNAGTYLTQVSIYGNNFNNVNDVRFGGVKAKSYTVLSSTMIAAIVDTGATGAVSVITSTGSASLPLFTYLPTSLGEVKSTKVKVYPNPANQIINIEAETIQDCHYEIIDGLGRTVLSGVLKGMHNQISIDALPEGLYILRISGEVNTSFKLTKSVQ
jgi:hypothetical protein